MPTLKEEVASKLPAKTDKVLVPEVVIPSIILPDWDSRVIKEEHVAAKVTPVYDRIKTGAVSAEELRNFKEHVQTLNQCIGGLRKAADDTKRFSLRLGEASREIVRNAEWRFDFYVEENRTFNGVAEWFEVRVGFKMPRIYGLIRGYEHAQKMLPMMEKAGLPQIEGELQSRYLNNNVGKPVMRDVIKYLTDKSVGMLEKDAFSVAEKIANDAKVIAWQLARDADAKAKKDDKTPAADRIREFADKAVKQALKNAGRTQIKVSVPEMRKPGATSANANTPAPETETAKVEERQPFLVMRDVIGKTNALGSRLARMIESLKDVEPVADGVTDAKVAAFLDALTYDAYREWQNVLAENADASAEMTRAMAQHLKAGKVAEKTAKAKAAGKVKVRKAHKPTTAPATDSATV